MRLPLTGSQLEDFLQLKLVTALDSCRKRAVVTFCLLKHIKPSNVL